MAQSNKPTRHSQATLATAALVLAIVAPFAGTAATLGEIEVLSRPGEPLEATINIATDAGESLSSNCISLSRGAATGAPYLARARIALEGTPGGHRLLIRGVEPLLDPATGLRIVVRCPGQGVSAYREYTSLFESAAARPSLPITGSAPSQGRAGAGGFPVMPGDSIASIAAAIQPRPGPARRAYAQALRELNPEIAGLKDGDPLPVNLMLALPDLRTVFSRPPAADATPVTNATSPAIANPAGTGQVAAVPGAAAEMPAKAAPRRQPAAEAPSKPATPPLAPVRPPAGATTGAPRFMLRLSAPEVDLSRSRGMDDAARARLRERQLVLDADDQVAALLSLRDSVRKLESRVAELQLKVSGIPESFGKSASPSVPSTVKSGPAPVLADAPKPVVAPAPKPVETPTPPPAAQAAESPKPAMPPAHIAGASKLPDAAPQAASPATAPRTAPKPASIATKPALPGEGLPEWWPWALVGLLLAAAATLAWLLMRRRPAPVADHPSVFPVVATPVVADELPAPLDIAEYEPEVVASENANRRVLASDAGLSTEFAERDVVALKRRYIEERFPEITNRMIVLEDPDSMVKAARLFYEDGASARAIELLKFTTEEYPEELKPWLALFELHRLERQVDAFADLARGFKERHGKLESWKKVQYFGREIDPANALYRDASVGIETIKFEVGKPPVPVSFDPVAENWLNAPMDFQNEVLANDLRRALLSGAGLSEEDLVANPMPALRSVEMFSVA